MTHSDPTTFALTLTASPFTSDQHARALRFGQAVVAAGHRLQQVFFYQDAVMAAQTAASCHADWARLAEQAGCPLYVCVSAAERRGVVEPAAPWEIVGLGDWLNGLQVQRHLHFGD